MPIIRHTPLRAFLQASMLSTDTEAQDVDDSKVPVGTDEYQRVTETNRTSDLQKVVLTTVHGAKGLEWPVVFIPCGTRRRESGRLTTG